MTLAPHIDPSVRGKEGKPGVLAKFCAAPGCISLAQQRHHMWSRSYLRGQPVEWVEVGGVTVQNTVGLCIRHHNEVTGEPGGHKAHIRWNPSTMAFEWWENGQFAWVCVGELTTSKAEPEAAAVRRKEGLCPSCGKPIREHKEKQPPGPKRKVKTWSIAVPDEAEDGAELLDVYVDDLAVLLGFGSEPSRLKRYHVLLPVLEWVSQQKGDFLADWEAE